MVECEAMQPYTGYSCGLNKFTVLTEQERRGYLGLKNSTRAVQQDAPIRVGMKPEPLLGIAEEWDWRPLGAVTEIKDQGKNFRCFCTCNVLM